MWKWARNIFKCVVYGKKFIQRSMTWISEACRRISGPVELLSRLWYNAEVCQSAGVSVVYTAITVRRDEGQAQGRWFWFGPTAARPEDRQTNSDGQVGVSEGRCQADNQPESGSGRFKLAPWHQTSDWQRKANNICSLRWKPEGRPVVPVGRKTLEM